MTTNTNTSSDTQPVRGLRYSLPASDSALWLGLRLPALLLLGLTISTAVVGLLTGLAVPLVALVLLLAGTGALLTVAGRPLVEWLPTAGRHLRNQLPPNRSWSAPLADPVPAQTAQGVPVRSRGSRSSRHGVPAADRGLRLPREYGGQRLLTVSGHGVGVGGGDRGVGFGMITDRRRGTVTTVLAVAGTDRFALLDPTAQDQRLASWGTALTALAADPRVLRVQWVQRSSAHPGDSGRWLQDRARTPHPGGPSDNPRHASPADDRSEQAVQDYLAMTEAVEQVAVQHEVWLAVQLARPARPRTRTRGPDDDLTADTADTDAGDGQLLEQVRDVAATLLTADLLARPLSATEIGWVLRRVTDLHTPHLHVDQLTEDSALSASQLGPSCRRIAFDHLRTDDSLHRSFAVIGWPRVAMPADWLAPLLLSPLPHPVARTLSVHLQPVPPHRAARQARAGQTKARLDAGDRNRLGFGDSAQQSWAEAEAASLEQELLGGYRMHRLAAVLILTAPNLQVLAEAGRSVRATAAASRIDLRPLHGQHDLGLVASLPFATLPGRRGRS